MAKLTKREKEGRRLVRAACNATGKPWPIEVVEGSCEAPRVKGETYYFTTPSGKTRVLHPGSYGYRTLYHHSTLRVVVGALWVEAALALGGEAPPEAVQDYAMEAVRLVEVSPR